MLRLSTTILKDGRPYADVFVSGRRRRVTLLRIGEKQIDDAVAEARYRAVLTALGVTERARMPQETISRLCEWYTSTVMPARGNRPSTRLKDARILTRLAAYLREQGVTTVTELAAQPNALNAYVLHRQATASASTINKEIAVFRAVMRAAVEYALIDALPVRRWPRLRMPERGYPEPLSSEEFSHVLQ